MTTDKLPGRAWIQRRLYLFVIGRSGVWTSWFEPLANFTRNVSEVVLVACAMQMAACLHTYTVSVLMAFEEHTSFTHTALAGAYEGEEQLSKQPTALAAIAQHLVLL